MAGLTYDATVKADVRQLAHDIIALEHEAKAIFIAGIYASGLMKSPWFYRLLLKILRWRHKLSLVAAWRLLWTVGNGGSRLLEDLTAQTANWAANGLDVYEKDSAGGFSQKEVDHIANLMRIATDDYS